jgi:predicted metal-dependent peptidase
MFSQTETDFSLDRHLISFLQDSPFFAELSRYIRKVPTDDIPTAAVAYDPKFDDLTLYWNPEFFRGMTDQEIRGVLTHEYYHLVFRHISERRKTPAKMWNVATDLAINSIISGHSNMALPDGCLMPGVFPKAPEGREWTKEEKDAMPIAALIASFPKDQASEWYFEKLKDKVEEERKKGDNSGGIPHPDGDPMGGLDSFDDHSAWDEIPEEMKDLVAGKVANAVEKAVKHADSQANGWGNIPAELRDAIRKSVTNIVDWRSVLRQFIGGIARGERTTTIKRINKRYPYIAPGTKRGYVAKLLIAIDQSGSVDDAQLALFFSELSSLTKKVSVTILPFDCAADLRDAFEWKKGTKVEAKRVRGGGTDFNAPTKVANDPKNRGRWDGMLILTDGECSAPGPSRVKRGWVVSPGRKLEFSTNELTITLDPTPKKTGAWR